MGNKIKELPNDMRPYEKVMRYGPESLTDAELLAVFLRSGTREKNCVELAEELLTFSGGSLPGLFSLSPEDFRKVPGIGKVKALELSLLRTITERVSRAGFPDRVLLKSPDMIYRYVRDGMRFLGKETLKALFLTTKCRLISEETISVGGVNTTLFPVREIMISALRHGAVLMVVVHNHPSGDPEPSEEDIASTAELRKASAIIGITLEDHIIVGDRTYVSMRERGYIS